MSSAIDRTVVRMKDFRPQWSQGVRSIKSTARTAARTTDGFVRSSPWTSVGLVLAAGLTVGLATRLTKALRARQAVRHRDSSMGDDPAAASG